MMNKEKKKRKKLIIIDQSVLRLALEGFFFLFSCDEVPLSLSLYYVQASSLSRMEAPLFSLRTLNSPTTHLLARGKM